MALPLLSPSISNNAFVKKPMWVPRVSMQVNKIRVAHSFAPAKMCPLTVKKDDYAVPV